ncbi:MAG: hypothetical protein PUB29_01200 [Bacteroidales bacterium]|nr:hypothetical protein [Bacteroidales bacterium]
MGLLGKPQGVFKLGESDKYVGSFISKDDVKTILDVCDSDLSDVKFNKINGIDYIDEAKLHESWKNNCIPNAVPIRKGNSTISLDEYILIEIIMRTYPSAKVESQFKWGRKYIDIYVEMDNRKFFIEFHGPGHFKKMNVYGDPEDPFVRKNQIEDEFGIPCYIWPYWIQRCSSNLKVLLGDSDAPSRGYGALWSTKVFFGEFFFPNSTQIIENITNQFKATPDGSYGYFYEAWSSDLGRIKQEHPILEKIRKGKKSIDLLIPPGADPNDKNKWLPKVLQSV